MSANVHVRDGNVHGTSAMWLTGGARSLTAHAVIKLMGKGKLRSTTGWDALNKSSWGAISFGFFLSISSTEVFLRGFFSVSVLATHSK